MRGFLALAFLSATHLVWGSPIENPGVPSLEQRQAFSDRFWLTDHDQPPTAKSGFYAISNDNGTTPAYWRHRGNTVTLPPPSVKHTAVDDGQHHSTLSARLPSYVNMYRSPDEQGCDEFLVQIPNPRSGQCYGSWNFALPNSVYIPSATQGDIFNFYTDSNCLNFEFQLFQYVGCYLFYNNVNSFWPCNLCG